MAAFCGAFLLAVQVVSGLVVAADADHECSEADCPVCQEIQGCVGNFQTLGSTSASADGLVPTVCPSGFDRLPVRVNRTPATTLHSLDVRFDE